MSEATVRAALKNAIDTVSNVGKTYDYERWAAEWGDFLALFKTTISGTAQIRGWEVAYRGNDAQRDPQFARQIIHAHAFQVRGYMRVDDSAASEKTFAALAESVQAAIDASVTIHSSTYLDATPATLQAFEPRSFGGVLCHYAQINITVTEQVT